MFQTFQLLNQTRAAEVFERARKLEYEAGQLSANGIAAERKNNRQAKATEARNTLVQELVYALQCDAGVAAYAVPRFFSVPIFNLAGENEFYGDHIDAASMTGLHGWPMRTDLSYTLFLAPPDSYDGGELRFHLPHTKIQVKLPAGGMVIYPSTLRHAVQPVTRGERYCMVGWIESMVHHTSHRELLYRLSRHCADIAQRHPADNELKDEMIAMLQGFVKELSV